jgi:hypothetical protein
VDYCWSKLPGLPVAEAAAVKTSPLDPRFRELLKGMELDFYSEAPASKTTDARKQRILKNVRKSFENLAQEGPMTQRMIEEALRGGVKFSVVDTDNAPRKMADLGVKLGSTNLGGAYVTKENVLMIMARHDGAYSEGVIKHELIHYLETIFGKEYDAGVVSKCKKALDELGSKAVLCIDKPTSAQCDQIRKEAAEYRNRVIRKASSKVSYEENPSIPNSGLAGALSLGDAFPKLKAKAAILKVVRDGDMCSLQLDSLQDMKTGVRRDPTREEKDLVNMALHLSEVPSRATINKNYLRAPDKIKVSEHYAQVSEQPERVLEGACPDMMPAAHEKLLTGSKDITDDKDRGL